MKANKSLMRILLLITLCVMHIQDNEGSVFIVPRKRDQSPIVFGRGRAQAPTSRESDDDLEPPQFFHYARPSHRMMRRMGYNLNRGDGLNFGKGRRIPLQPFVPEGKPHNYYDCTRRGLGYVTLPLQLEPKSDGLSLSWSNWITNVSVVDSRVSSSHCGTVFLLLKKIFPSGVAILFSIDFECGKTLQNSRYG